MQSKLAFPGGAHAGAHASRGMAAVRVRHCCTAPRAGAEIFPGETDENLLTETSSIADATSSYPAVSNDSNDVQGVTNGLQHTVSTANQVTEGMRDCSEADFQPMTPAAASNFDQLALGSTLVSGPMVAARHKDTDSVVAKETSSPQFKSNVSARSLEASQADSLLSDDTDFFSVTRQAIPVSTESAPDLAAPVTTPAGPSAAAARSAPSTPVRVTAVSDKFSTGAEPSPGNHEGFITGRPSPSATTTPRPYLASGPGTDPRGYPAFKFDENAASQYSSAAQSMPMRPNYEPRYSSRSSNCDSAPPPMADALSSSKSVGMPSGRAESYGYKRVPQEGGPGYGFSRASAPQQQQAPPQRMYQYRVPPDYGPPDYGSPGGPLPLSPPGGRGLPPPGYGPQQSDPWDIFEPGSTIGFPQGLLHIDGGVYGGYGGGGGGSGYAGPGPSYGGPSSSYGYGGGYAAPAPPPPQQSYQYGGYGGGGSGYSQQQQYYAPPPPGQYGGGGGQPGGSYRGAPPQADPGQYYGGNYAAPPTPRRAAPPPQENYTYKARAPAGNMPEENLSAYSYGNAYSGGTGFGSGGNYGGQTSYGSPLPGNFGGAQQEEASYPGIELLSPGYPEFERHARQTGSTAGGRGGSQELRYPGIEGGTASVQQQRAIAPAGITEYSDRLTPPAYGSSYSGFTAPSAYEVAPPEAYAPYGAVPRGGGGYYGAPGPALGPPDAYGYWGPVYGGGQFYPQRPMGFTSPEEAVPIAARLPRVLVADEVSPGEQFALPRADGGAHGLVESVLPFAALPDASNVAMLAAANAPEPSLHLGVLAAALCCIVAAAAGVREPQGAEAKEG